MDITSGATPQRPTATLNIRGQSVVIRKLTPLDHMRLFEMLGGDLSGNRAYLNLALTAASVAKIGDTDEPFPTNKAQVEAMVQRLDFAGLNAVSAAYEKNFGAAESGDPADVKK